MKTIKTVLLKALIQLLVAALLWANSLLLSQASANDSFQAISGSAISAQEARHFLQDSMLRHQVPGLSIAVINDAQIVYADSLGLADLEQQRPVKSETLFEAASLSKPLFAYFVMGFVQEGKLDLDKPLCRYLKHPDLPLDKNARMLTARMVLGHTSGLPNWRSELKDKQLRFIAKPGTQYTYSGEAYQYLALVLAKIENTDARGLDRIFQQRVLQNLNMRHTYFFTPDNERANKALPYQQGKRMPMNSPATEFGAAYAAETTVDDYAQWVIALMQQQGLHENTYKKFFEAQRVPVPADHPERAIGMTDRALGFAIHEFPEIGSLYVHGGNNEGYTALVVFSAEKRWGLVLFTNADQASDFLLEVFGLMSGAAAQK